jgi:hypothetical protein
MRKLSKGVAAALLVALLSVQSGVILAQCSPTNPACAPSAPRTGGSAGGGVGVQVDVGSAAKAIGGLFKKKKKKPVEQTPVATAPVEQPKPKIIFVPSPNVVIAKPRPRVVQATVNPRPVQTTRVVIAPKKAALTPRPAIIRKVTRTVASPVAVPVTAAAIAPESIVETPITAPEPAVEIADPPAAVATPVATVMPEATQPAAPKSDNTVAIMIAAAVAALVAAGTAAKFLLTPKVAFNCTIPDGSSQMVSTPSLTPPEVKFTVAIPEFAATIPDTIAIVA